MGDSQGAEISNKIRSAIKAKLLELGAYVDEELPDYVMVMIANKKTKQQMADDLNLFLGSSANVFTDWLHEVLDKLQAISTSGITGDSQTGKENVATKSKKKSHLAEKNAPTTAKGSEKSSRKSDPSTSSPSKVADESTKSSTKRKHAAQRSLSKEKHRSRSLSKEKVVAKRRRSGSKERHRKGSEHKPKRRSPTPPTPDLSPAPEAGKKSAAAPEKVKEHHGGKSGDEKRSRKQRMPIEAPPPSAKENDEEDMIELAVGDALNEFEEESHWKANGESSLHQRFSTRVPVQPPTNVVLPMQRSCSPEACPSRKQRSYVAQVVHNAPLPEEEYDPLHPQIGTVASVVRVTQRKSKLPPELQAKPKLFLKAISDVNKSLKPVKLERGGKIKRESYGSSDEVEAEAATAECADGASTSTANTQPELFTRKRRKQLAKEEREAARAAKRQARASRKRSAHSPSPDGTAETDGEEGEEWVEQMPGDVGAKPAGHSKSSRHGRRRVERIKSEEQDDELDNKAYAMPIRVNTGKDVRKVEVESRSGDPPVPTSPSKPAQRVQPTPAAPGPLPAIVGLERSRIDQEELIVDAALHSGPSSSKVTFVVTLDGIDAKTFRLKFGDQSDKETAEVNQAAPSQAKEPLSSPVGAKKVPKTSDSSALGILTEPKAATVPSRSISNSSSPTPASLLGLSHPTATVKPVSICVDSDEDEGENTHSGALASIADQLVSPTFSQGTAKLAHTDTAENSREKIMERCRFWPACRLGEECEFYHPTTACKVFPNCRFGDRCLFIHPNCKYDAFCTNPNCPYTHATRRMGPLPPPPGPRPSYYTQPPHLSRAAPCRFGSECATPGCRFKHPTPTTAVPCKFGKMCTREDCIFSHPPTQATNNAAGGNKFRWIARLEPPRS